MPAQALENFPLFIFCRFPGPTNKKLQFGIIIWEVLNLHDGGLHENKIQNSRATIKCNFPQGGGVCGGVLEFDEAGRIVGTGPRDRYKVIVAA